MHSTLVAGSSSIMPTPHHTHHCSTVAAAYVCWMEVMPQLGHSAVVAGSGSQQQQQSDRCQLHFSKAEGIYSEVQSCAAH